jgi:phage baseplate assembly protein W
MAKYFGYNPPFIGGQQNVLSRQEDVQLIRNDLLQLLLTSPGDRVHRPEFGTPIRQMLFENVSPSDLEVLRSDLVGIIQRQEPRIIVQALNIIPQLNSNAFRIHLVAVLRDDPRVNISIDRLFQSN